MANFGAIAEAPDGVKSLRGLVLRLAVEGALSEPLDEDDAPDVLLRSIRKACETTAEDNGWRFKALPDRVEPFCRAPSRWACESLGNLGVALGGGTPSKQRHEFWEGDIPWVSPKDMKRDVIDDSIDHVSELAVESSAAKLIDAPALLMVLRGMILAHSFPVAITSRSVTINQDLKALVLGDPRTAPYLLLAMRAAKNAVLSLVETSSHGTCRLSAAAVLGLGVPIPPIAEQKRIVAKVEQLMTMLDDLEQHQERKRTVAIHVSKASLDSLVNADDPDQLARAWERVSENFRVIAGSRDALDDVTDSVLSLAMSGSLSRPPERSDTLGIVGRAVAGVAEANRKTRRRGTVEPDVPKSERLRTTPAWWTWTRLGAVTEISGGVTKGRKLAGRTTTVLPYLRVANVQRWQLELDLMKEIEIPSDEIEKYRLIRGDVLLTEGGDWDKLGRAVVWRDELELCLHQNHVFKVRMVTDEILPEWVEAWCNCRAGRTYFQGAAKQTTNLASINMTQLRNLPIPLPSRVEQAEILAHNRRLRAECHRVQQLLAAHSDAAARVATAATSPATV